MRELDELLGGFLDTQYDGLSDAEKTAFGELLELPDPQLHSYLLGREIPAQEEHSALLRRLRDPAT